jgi:hypothetical protein
LPDNPDDAPEFLYVSAKDVVAVVEQDDTIPPGIPDVELSDAGELCSFDAFRAIYQLDGPARAHVAVIARAAETHNC